MHRFFVPRDGIDGDSAHLDGDDARQVARVLRLREGESIILLDNSGMEYKARITDVSDKRVGLSIIESGPAGPEPRSRVAVVQGLPKGDKLEHIIQKCTELGVSSIFPVSTGRAVVQLDDKRASERLVRWRRVAKEAAEQSGRGIIPEVGALGPWKAVLKRLVDNGWNLVILWEGARDTGVVSALRGLWPDGNPEGKPVAFCIGPEGGLDESEVDYAVGLGAVVATMGPRVLRTETAGPTAVAGAMMVSGDMP